MLLSDNDPMKFKTYMASPVSLFLTALDAFTKKHKEPEKVVSKETAGKRK